MQIKTTMRCQYILTRVEKKQNLIILNAGKDEEQFRLSYVAGGLQNGTATLENRLADFNKVKTYTYLRLNNLTPKYLHK